MAVDVTRKEERAADDVARKEEAPIDWEHKGHDAGIYDEDVACVLRRVRFRGGEDTRNV